MSSSGSGKDTRFVVVTPQGLGDTLEATPLLSALRNAYPKAHIDAVVMRAQARDLLLDLDGIVDEVVYLPYWERGNRAFLAAASQLPWRSRADAAFLTYPAGRPVYLGLLSLVNSRIRYAHRYDDSIVRSVAAATIHQIPISKSHNVLRNLDLLRAAGISAPAPERYSVPKDWNRTGERQQNVVVMHIGTIAHHGLEAKRWPETSFAELGRRLLQRGYELVVLAGPAEKDETVRVVEAMPGSRLQTGSLLDAARTIASASAVIANDSGIAHVAAGVGTPVLALHGPTPVEYGPYGRDAIAFRPTACAPCFDVVRTDASCKLGIGHACLKRDLSVDIVEARMLELLGGER